MAITDDPLDQRNHRHGHDRGSQPNDDIITTDDDLKTLAKKSRSGGIQARKQEAELRTDYFYDIGIESHIRHILDAQFAAPANMKHQISWRNIVKAIIRKTALVYKDAPVREIFVESEEVQDIPDPENEGSNKLERIKVDIPSKADRPIFLSW